MSEKDFRIFYDNRSRSWVIANDYKMRRLISKGYSIKKAEDNSHGHLKNKDTAEKIKGNILSNSKEKSRNIRILGCYVRICDSTYKHYSWVCGLYETKKGKDKQQYFKVNNGVFR